MVFYIGCTGLLPDQFQATGRKVDEIKDLYPTLKVAPAEKEALFFDLGQDLLLSIYPKEVLFSR